MIKSFASRIWIRVIFIVFCVVSQQFHPPMYLQTIKSCRVNDINCWKTNIWFCKGFSANHPCHVPVTFNSVQLAKLSFPKCFCTS